MSVRPYPSLLAARATLGAASAQGEALDRLLALGLPTPRDDAYRYTGFRALERRNLVPVPSTSAALPDLPLAEYRLVFRNGQYCAAESALPAGVTLAAEPMPVPASDAATERLRLLHCALGGTRLHLTVAADADVAFDLLCLSDSGGAYPALRIDVGSHARVHLHEFQTHTPGVDAADGVSALMLDFSLAAGATVDHAVLQLGGAHSLLFGDVRARLAADARYAHHSAALTAQLSRLDLNIELAGRGASATLDGLFLADGQREQHLRTVVTHAARDATSAQLYRGVATDRGRGSYDGKVVVLAGADGTQSSQSSRNLLLSATATVETRPQLEIHADAVKCAHGATTGSLDDRMLFYLLSRGLDPATARAVLTYAFLGDALTGFAPALRRCIETRALGVLPAADLIREFVA